MSIIGKVISRTRTNGTTVSSSSDTNRPRNYLKTILDRRDAVPNVRRLGEPGPTHLSSLIGICPRARVLAVRYGIVVSEVVNGSMRVIWCRGLAAEGHVIQQFQASCAPMMFGDWSCTCRRTTHRGHCPRPGTVCSTCQNSVSTYTGCLLSDPANGIVGNADLVYVRDGLYVPVEIKSLENKERFDNLTKPLPDHRNQVLGYHRLLRANGFPVCAEPVVIYVLTAWRFGSPYKEFEVTITPSDETAVDGMVAKGREVHDCLQTDHLLPPRLALCPNAQSTTARECGACAMCFNIEG